MLLRESSAFVISTGPVYPQTAASRGLGQDRSSRQRGAARAPRHHRFNDIGRQEQCRV